MYGSRARIGLLVPAINTTMEMDFHRFIPEGVSVHVARVISEGIEGTIDSLASMVKNVGEAVKEVAKARVDVICFGCTSASFFGGYKSDEELMRTMAEIGGIPAFTTSTAVLEALNALNIIRISVATPYTREINEKLRLFLTENGFQVTRIEGLLLKDVWEHACVSPDVIYGLAREVNVADAEGVFISCTQLQAVDIIEELERDIQKPVITAIQTSIWMALRKVAIFDSIPGLGKLGQI